MSKHAATQEKMGKLHAALADAFSRVLKKYDERLTLLDEASMRDLEDDVLVEMLAADFEPSPAMLRAIAAFLKDNEIQFSNDEIKELSQLERQLEEKRKRRGGGLMSLDQLASDG